MQVLEVSDLFCCLIHFSLFFGHGAEETELIYVAQTSSLAHSDNSSGFSKRKIEYFLDKGRPSHLYVCMYVCMYCTALHCTALHCTALHCTALHCTALHCTALHCMYVCMYVRMYVCMYVYVCVHPRTHAHMYACKHVCVNIEQIPPMGHLPGKCGICWSW